MAKTSLATRITLTAILLMITMGGFAQRKPSTPLRPIECDSIYLMDFFWYNLQQKALNTTMTTQPAAAHKVKALSQSRIAKLEHQCALTLDSLNLLGELPDGSLAQSLKLFKQCLTLNQLTGKAKYMDIAEHILTNSILAHWQHEAPGAAKDEATQLLRNISQMAYSTSGSNVYVNMLMRTNAHIKTKKLDLFLRSINSSPWYNETTISVSNNNDPIEVEDYDSLNIYQKRIYHDSTRHQPPCDASLCLRIPSWATSTTSLPNFSATTLRKNNVVIMVNGTALHHPIVENGYVVITRQWTPGDIVTIRIPNPIMRITHNDKPDSVALQRGPFVYYYIGTGASDSLDRKAAINQQFTKTDRAVLLDGKLSGGEGKFFALPYFKSGEKEKLFMPAK